MGVSLTEAPLDRDPLDRDPLGQRPIGQRPHWTKTPGQRQPWTGGPWTETPSRRNMGPGNQTGSDIILTHGNKMTDTCENITLLQTSFAVIKY